MEENKAGNAAEVGEAEYNSSDYTHNLDPSMESNSNVEQQAATAAQGGADDDDGANEGGDGIEHRSKAMEAVMQLAQAASQQHQYKEGSDQQQHQQHGHVGNPEVHHDPLPVNNSSDDVADPDKRGSKRRPSQGAAADAGSLRGNKVARQSDTSGEGTHNLPFPESWSEGHLPDEIQQAYQQHLAQAVGYPSSSSAPSTAATTTPSKAKSATETLTASPGENKPARQLSTSKRAAQNRAAQRAFRERRDKYVKVLESKATRLEEAIKVATECRRRYAESLQTIDGLRHDNHTLRVALGALSGTQVGNPPATMKVEEYLSTLPQIPPLSTREEEELLASSGSGDVGRGGRGQGSPQNQQNPFGQDSGSSSHDASRHQQTSPMEEDNNPSLDSLSAVAAAAAAAAAHGHQQDHQNQDQDQHRDESVPTPPAPHNQDNIDPATSSTNQPAAESTASAST